MANKQHSLWRSLDWWTVALYLVLVIAGWFSICGASYTYGEMDFFSLSTRSGMQIIWIATAVAIAGILIATKSQYYESTAMIVYLLLMLLLIATIFNPHEVKGSRSWLFIGSFRLQPAEFAKVATALALAKVLSEHGFVLTTIRGMLRALAVIFLPVIAIICEKETGSALVYLAFFLVLYREGMTGSILFIAIAMVLYFIVGVKYDDVLLANTPTSVGQYAVFVMILLFTCMLMRVYGKEQRPPYILLAIAVIGTVVATLFAIYVIPFDIAWALIALLALVVILLLIHWLRTTNLTYALITAFILGSTVFYYSVDYTMDNILQAHQRTRINVLLGIEDDLRGAGYNVHQSEIAIGSGGLQGKGFLNGTQTKLKFVPEQDTDFIFCTIGEEEGFIGSAIVLLLFLTLILRVLAIAERQTFPFARIYGYGVASIILFHVTVNIGMVLGLMPVIGIPLPFFSYGGSSLWSFTILLFILLRLDADRNKRLFE